MFVCHYVLFNKKKKQQGIPVVKSLPKGSKYLMDNYYTYVDHTNTVYINKYTLYKYRRLQNKLTFAFLFHSYN